MYITVKRVIEFPKIVMSFLEGHLPRGPIYIEQDQRHFKSKIDRPPIASPGEVCKYVTKIIYFIAAVQIKIKFKLFVTIFISLPSAIPSTICFSYTLFVKRKHFRSHRSVLSL